MPGFYISTYRTHNEIDNYYNEKCIKNEIKNNKYVIKRNTLNRFLDDKVFSENEKYIIIVEGVILNKKDLIQKYNKKTFFDTIVHMFEEVGESFFKEFRGSFSGALYSKKDDYWIIYTNHVGDTPVFYYYNDNNFIVGSEINYIVETLKKENINFNINEQSIYSILTYSFMIDDQTLIKEIKKIDLGSYIKITKNQLKEFKYFELTDDRYDVKDMSIDELVEQIDIKFKNAINLEYSKDIEYGYQHFNELSGGLDSRMTLWVAHELGYKNNLVVTYSKSGYYDQKIAEEITSYLQYNWIFKSLDDPNIIFDLDENVKMNFGLNCYFNVTKSNATYKLINFDNIGICHTGQIGDVVLGTFLNSVENNKLSTFKYAESYKLIDRLDKNILEKYKNEELFAMNVRALRGALNSHIIRKNYFETTSPFLDIDFLEFCMSIPLEYRINHKLYKQWMKKKYPKACDFIWEKTKSKVNASDFRVFINKAIILGPKKIARIMGVKTKVKPNSMNPYDYWYQNNTHIKQFMDTYYKNEINNYKISKRLREDMIYLYNEGNALEKSQVLTVLSTLKLYF